VIEIAKTIGLDPEGQDRKQQMPRQVRGQSIVDQLADGNAALRQQGPYAASSKSSH